MMCFSSFFGIIWQKVKKNTSWKFTDELSITFQSSVSGLSQGTQQLLFLISRCFSTCYCVRVSRLVQSHRLWTERLKFPPKCVETLFVYSYMLISIQFLLYNYKNGWNMKRKWYTCQIIVYVWEIFWAKQIFHILNGLVVTQHNMFCKQTAEKSFLVVAYKSSHWHDSYNTK